MSDKKSKIIPLNEGMVKKGGLNRAPKTSKPDFTPKPLASTNTTTNSNNSQNSSNSTSKKD